MIFSSVIFLHFFLPLFLAIYFLAPQKNVRLKNSIILVFSLLFYLWGEPRLILALAICTFANWIAGLLLEKMQDKTARKAVVCFALGTSLGQLFYYKYYTFFLTTLRDAGNWLNVDLVSRVPEIVLPIGISFYTFQALSYTLDVYRKQTRATRNLATFATYIALFPQLVAGPIVRYTEIASELASRCTSLTGLLSGVQRFLVGLMKKILIANVMGSIADQIFAIPVAQQHGLTWWFGAIAYTLQIYFDFSAYSDMAIGLGRILGFTFPENFAHPYAATSIREFWQRWHITLSRWLRDYVYIPLGGSRVSTGKTYRNLLIVFLLCGLWHGANWTFIAWGLFHGLFLIAERTGWSGVLASLPAPLRHAYTMLVVCIGWVFFRADSIAQATEILRAMFFMLPESGRPPLVSILEFATPPAILTMLAAIVGSSGWPARTYKQMLRKANSTGKITACVCNGVALVGTAALLGLCILHLANGSYNPFIYFRF